jgi:protein-disulfide isomerase
MNGTTPEEEHVIAPSTTATSSQPLVASVKSTLGLPIAIVLAAVLIAGAIVYTGSKNNGAKVQEGAGTEKQDTKVEVAPVTEKDHIRGNPNAPIMIVEYSDFECPFCKNFHETMNKIMTDYGADGQVAWVYRSFPLQQLHPNAPKIAEAAECVASLGGNDAFWKFTDLVFGERGVNDPTNIAKLPEYAERAGVDKAKFSKCLADGTFKDVIAANIDAAIKTGARGTPHSFLIVGNQQGVIDGAQPYATVKRMVDTMISQLGGSDTKK